MANMKCWDTDAGVFHPNPAVTFGDVLNSHMTTAG